jgi:hypothetical protein
LWKARRYHRADSHDDVVFVVAFPPGLHDFKEAPRRRSYFAFFGARIPSICAM